MLVTINGEARNLNGQLSIRDLLKELQVEEKIVALSINASLVKRDTWDSTLIKENDKIELLQFMGGG